MKVEEKKLEQYTLLTPTTPIVQIDMENVISMAQELLLSRKIIKEFWFCNLVKPFFRLKQLLDEYERM